MGSITVQQDAESSAWEVESASHGIHWTFIHEEDARDAAGTLEAMLGAHVLLPQPGVGAEPGSGAAEP